MKLELDKKYYDENTDFPIICTINEWYVKHNIKEESKPLYESVFELFINDKIQNKTKQS